MHPLASVRASTSGKALLPLSKCHHSVDKHTISQSFRPDHRWSFLPWGSLVISASLVWHHPIFGIHAISLESQQRISSLVFIPALGKTLNSNSNERNHKCDNLPWASARLKVHFKASWFLHTVNLWPFNEAVISKQPEYSQKFSMCCTVVLLCGIQRLWQIPEWLFRSVWLFVH